MNIKIQTKSLILYVLDHEMMTLRAFLTLLITASVVSLTIAQKVSGKVVDQETDEPLIGASVLIQGTTKGTVTDIDGNFSLNWDGDYPIQLVFSYVGYSSKTVEATEASYQEYSLGSDALTMDIVEVKGQRISDKQKESPLTIEALDNVAIKQAASADFYESLGNLKGVDLTTASLGFKVINTRGFNSTSPVRSLQLIDGVDNQSPGLNFSLGNFLGVPDLDINRVELIAGASSAFYGPNAFNGVISMQTKNPFYHRGLSAEIKAGERNLISTSIRWADIVTNKKGLPFMAYKVNLYYLRADDWEAENYTPVFGSESKADNPGGFDGVNIYGDEYSSLNDFRDVLNQPGLGLIHRTGYREIDLVNYNAENLKANAAVHFRLQPEKEQLSPELIASSSYGGGTTVYQGDNRFFLDNIRFYQHRLELQKRDNYFLRVYATHEDAGDSYDPYFTAIQLQEQAKETGQWSRNYSSWWSSNVTTPLQNMEGYPRGSDFLGDPEGFRQAINQFLDPFQDSLYVWHDRAEQIANMADFLTVSEDYYEPGTARFDSAFNDITSRISYEEGGTRFYDKSALVHTHGEYRFNDVVQKDEGITDLDLIFGANARWFLPDSRGSILLDTAGREIQTFEYGVYGGGTMGIGDKVKVNVSLRMDKHQNYDYLFSPAASVVYNPSINQFLRFSLSSAIRNPTLSDQFLFYNVGPAILIGNLDGFEGVFSPESFIDYLNTRNRDTLESFNIDPIRPERARTVEIGYRTTLWDRLFLDLGYYYTFYNDFIGFQLAVESDFDPVFGLPLNTQVYRVSANAQDQVTTQGFAIGGNYYFGNYYSLNGNYSWNKLNTATDDPIIPAFNTPEHKYNIGVSGRNIPLDLGFVQLNNFGFNLNYKWIEGFLFEGSPQFTGFIDSYGLIDGQVNIFLDRINTTVKIGGSNLMNNMVFQTYGGPRVGRLAYISLNYNWEKL